MYSFTVLEVRAFQWVIRDAPPLEDPGESASLGFPGFQRPLVSLDSWSLPLPSKAAAPSSASIFTSPSLTCPPPSSLSQVSSSYHCSHLGHPREPSVWTLSHLQRPLCHHTPGGVRSLECLSLWSWLSHGLQRHLRYSPAAVLSCTYSYESKLCIVQVSVHILCL